MKKVFILLLCSLFLIVKNSFSDEKVKPFKDASIESDSKVSKKVNFDLYVMSQCPYSAAVEQALIKARRIFENKININIYFIANYKDGKFTSLHGTGEVEEDMRQLVMLKHFSDKFWDYLELRDTNVRRLDNWFGVLFILGIEKWVIERLVKNEGKDLLLKNIKKAQKLNITASPTIYIDGQLYEGRLDASSLIVAICKRLQKKDTLCSRIPECFSDQDCLMPGKQGKCTGKGTLQAKCVVTDLPKIKAFLINSDRCRQCDYYKDILQLVNRRYRSLSVEVVDIKSRKIKKLADELGIEGLPALAFDKNIEKIKGFKADLDSGILKKTKSDYYLLSSQLLTNKFFWKRPELKNQMNIFIMSHCPFSISLLKQIIEKIRNKKINYKVNIHYVLKREKDTEIGSLHGEDELKEDLRQLIIKKYYPGKFFDYIDCRNKDIKNSDWVECARQYSIDESFIINKSKEEADLLLSNELKLCQDLDISSSPTVLWENNYKITNLDELKTIEGLSDLKKLKGKCR